MKVLVAGDFVPMDRVAKLIERDRFQDVFGEVRPLMAEVEYGIVNLESPVVLSERTSPIEKNGPNLKCTRKAVDALKWAGFDMVTLANNHFFDYGKEGVADTMAVCKEKGVETVGGGNNLDEAQKIFFKEIGGEVLAIINCCEHEFSIASHDRAGSNPLNPIEQYYQIQEARKKADYVLLIVHGGHEHYQLPSPRMVETYRFFIDVGADAVVNHHQHCFSGYELYKSKPIFYGVGNFCFDRGNKRNQIWNEGFLVKVVFDKERTSHELYPYIQGNTNAGVELIEGQQRNKFNEELKKLNTIIADGALLGKCFEEFVEKRCKGMLVNFSPYTNRYLKALYVRGLLPFGWKKSKILAMKNCVECEAHRDMLCKIL